MESIEAGVPLPDQTPKLKARALRVATVAEAQAGSLEDGADQDALEWIKENPERAIKLFSLIKGNHYYVPKGAVIKEGWIPYIYVLPSQKQIGIAAYPGTHLWQKFDRILVIEKEVEVARGKRSKKQ